MGMELASMFMVVRPNLKWSFMYSNLLVLNYDAQNFFDILVFSLISAYYKVYTFQLFPLIFIFLEKVLILLLIDGLTNDCS